VEHYYALIMAGGGGTRLWPKSRQSTPKQLLPLVDEVSMFKASVDRLAPLFTPEQIYVVTGQKYVKALQDETPQIPAANFVVEPYGRESGPAAALGMAVIQQRDPQATVAILTADHHIEKQDAFRAVLAAAYEMAQGGYITTLGITPTEPSTGFGYIQQGEALTTVQGYTAFVAKGFKEKPTQEVAQQFLESGEYTWNSGMFILKTETGLAEFAHQRPDIYAQFSILMPTVDTPSFETTLTTIWDQVEKISLDYAIMEKADKMAVIPIEIGWNDVGNWASMYEVWDLDAQGNGFKGTPKVPITLQSKNTLVYSDKLVVTIGVEDLIVVETPDAILICHKDKTQDVKKAVEQLRARNHHEYL
jgi:mannose-1-phosphate guanylyltransferase